MQLKKPKHSPFLHRHHIKCNLVIHSSHSYQKSVSFILFMGWNCGQETLSYRMNHNSLAETYSFIWYCVEHPTPTPQLLPHHLIHGWIRSLQLLTRTQNLFFLIDRHFQNDEIWRRTRLMETRWRNQQHAQRTSNDSQITVGNLALENYNKHIITRLL